MDAIVIGGGIAGASIAYELAADRQTVLLEAEKVVAKHTTGRSAATWIDSYGSPFVRELSEASLDWFLNPPVQIDGPLTHAMGCLWLGVEGQEGRLKELALTPGVEVIDGAQVEELCPVLRPGMVREAVYDSRALDLDVAGLHHAYLRAFKSSGGAVHTSAALTSAKRVDGIWQVSTQAGEFEAPLLINAAGAWGDAVAAACGVAPIGLEPRRRSIFQSVPRERVAPFPFTITIDESFYIKPEGDGVLCSPVDAEPQAPGDPKPDELEIARAIEAINEATTLGIRSVRTSWAGQRTFSQDGDPVAKFDPEIDGFYWFVGQAGWGIQIAPAHAMRAAEQIRQREML